MSSFTHITGCLDIASLLKIYSLKCPRIYTISVLKILMADYLKIIQSGLCKNTKHTQIASLSDFLTYGQVSSRLNFFPKISV